MTMSPVTSMTSASARMSLPTSAILSPSIRTSPPEMSPSFGSTVRTCPPLKRIRSATPLSSLCSTVDFAVPLQILALAAMGCQEERILCPRFGPAEFRPPEQSLLASTSSVSRLEAVIGCQVPSRWVCRMVAEPRRSGRAYLAAALEVDRGHVGVAIARDSAFGERRLDPGEVAGTQLDVGGSNVLLQVGHALGSGDRDDVVSLAEHPAQCELSRSDSLLRSDLLDALDELEIPPEVVSLEAWVVAAEVVRLEVIDRAKPSGEKSSPQRTVGHEANAKLAHRGEDLIFRAPAP